MPYGTILEGGGNKLGLRITSGSVSVKVVLHSEGQGESGGDLEAC